MVESRQSQHFTDIIYTVVVVPIITEAHVHVCLHDRIFSQHTLAYPEVKTEKNSKEDANLQTKINRVGYCKSVTEYRLTARIIAYE